MIGLGIDAGGSSTRWLLRSEDGAVASGRLQSISGLLFDELSRRTAFERVRVLASQVLSQAPPARVVAGVAGLEDLDATAQALTAELAAAFGLPETSVQVLNDMRIAYRAVFSPGAGVLSYGGTGSIACFEAESGAFARVGGHGYLIDDAGGGYAIGRRALQYVLRRADERGSPAIGGLAEATYGHLGCRDWPGIRAVVYEGGRTRVAALAPAVAAAAAAGDRDASRILADAGRELARLARVMAQRVEAAQHPLPVALCGGVVRLGASLTDSFTDALNGREVRVVDVEPVEAAALMAVEAM